MTAVSNWMIAVKIQLLQNLLIGDVVPCALTEGEEISCEEISKTPVNDSGFFTVTVLIRVPR
ncbi:MAG: hypothetical protein ACOX2X_08815, partial [Peptococcia bacterium]